MDGIERKVDHYRFGPFCIEPKTGVLKRNGQPVPLAPKAFDVLQLLVSRPGDVLSKEAIRAAVWKDTHVEFKNIGVQIAAIRKVLGDRANGPIYVETVGRRGYRFLAIVTTELCRQSANDTRAAERPLNSAAPCPSWPRGASLVTAILGIACVLAVVRSRTTFDSSIERGKMPPTAARDASPNVTARALYERGAYYSTQPGPDAVRNAIAYLSAATRRDPSFAVAYSLLAEQHVIFADAIGRADPELNAAGQAAAKAIQLDPKLARAWLVLAVVQSELRWDWTGAESIYRHALALDTSSALTREWFGSYLALTGRSEEALAHARRAVNLAPTRGASHRNLGEILLYTGDCEHAVTPLRDALEIRPSNEWVKDLLTRAYVCLDERRDGAGQEFFERVLPSFGPPSLSDLGEAYEHGRWRHVQRARLDDLLAQAQVRTVDPIVLASAYASLGDRAKALDAIERAFVEHSSMLRYVALEPAFKGLRDEPRYQHVLERMRLPSQTSPS